MRFSLIAFLLLALTQLGFGQTDSVNFVVTNYNADGSVATESISRVPGSEDLHDIRFIRQRFFIPMHFPDHLYDDQFVSETITVNSSEDPNKDPQSVWTDSYTYDADSRLIGFAHSSCARCPNLPYKYEITYTDSRPISLVGGFSPKEQVYEFGYDDEGNVIEVVAYRSGKLAKTIIQQE